MDIKLGHLGVGWISIMKCLKQLFFINFNKVLLQLRLDFFIYHEKVSKKYINQEEVSKVMETP